MTLAFQGSGTVNPTAVTQADGTYTIPNVPDGSYGKLQVLGQGYSGAQSVTVTGTGTTTKNFSLRKDLATHGSGASIAGQSGVVFQGCSPKQAVDQNLATGWSTNVHSGTSTDPTNQFDPKSFVVKLDKAYDVKGFAVDPSASCGDGGSASTGGYTIETSPDNSTWTNASTGAFTTADDGHLNSLSSADGPTAVQFVRFTVTSNQTPDFTHNCPNGAFAGCQYVDLTELEIYGS